MAANVEIASARITGTDKTITIVLRPAEPRWGQPKDLYLVTREGHAAFNYLSSGQDTEAAARAEANELWLDAVQRTRAWVLESV